MNNSNTEATLVSKASTIFKQINRNIEPISYSLISVAAYIGIFSSLSLIA